MAVPAMPVKSIRGFSVDNQAGPAKQLHAPWDGTTDIRVADPVVMTSGILARGDNTSTAIAGFGAEPTARYEVRQIVTMPYNLDSSGRKVIQYYTAGRGNSIVASTKASRATVQSDVGTACDLAPQLSSAVPVITQGGTSGATTYNYKVSPKNLVGEAKGAASQTATTAGNATLSAANYNILTIPNTPGANSFVIYRGSQFIAEVTANPTGTTVYNDIGVTANAAVIPLTINQSGWLIDPSLTSVGIYRIVGLVDPEGTLGGRVRFVVTAAGQQLV